MGTGDSSEAAFEINESAPHAALSQTVLTWAACPSEAACAESAHHEVHPGQVHRQSCEPAGAYLGTQTACIRTEPGSTGGSDWRRQSPTRGQWP